MYLVSSAESPQQSYHTKNRHVSCHVCNSHSLVKQLYIHHHCCLLNIRNCASEMPVPERCVGFERATVCRTWVWFLCGLVTGAFV